MSIEITNNYNSVYENTYASSRKEAVKKEETKETAATQKKTETVKKSGNEEYLKNLQKQVPYIKLQTGYGINTNNDGKVNVVDVNPKLLEKMQNDPKAAKEYTQRLKDVESCAKFFNNFFDSRGSTVVCRHDYLDENGNYTNFTVTVRKDELNEKLCKEAQENSEKQIEKSRGKNRENAEQLAEKLEKKAEEAKDVSEEKEADNKIQISDNSVKDKAEQLLDEKLSKSKDGTIYLYDTDIKTIIEAAKEDNEGKAMSKQQAVVGANLDLQA